MCVPFFGKGSTKREQKLLLLSDPYRENGRGQKMYRPAYPAPMIVGISTVQCSGMMAGSPQYRISVVLMWLHKSCRPIQTFSFSKGSPQERRASLSRWSAAMLPRGAPARTMFGRPAIHPSIHPTKDASRFSWNLSCAASTLSCL